MPIQFVKTESMGESGQSPKFIYITSDDNTVLETGYLNPIVTRFNTPLSVTDMAVVTSNVSPTETKTGIYNIQYENGNWTLLDILPPPPPVTGALSLGLGVEVYKENLATVLQFKSLVAGNNVTITPHDDHVTIESVTGGFAPGDNYTITGDFEFEGGFDVNSPDPVTISSGGLLVLQSATDIVRVLADSIDFVATGGNASFRADNGDMTIFSTNGQCNLSGVTMALGADTSLNVSTSNGTMQFNSTDGNINLFAGTGATAGGMSIGSDHGDISISVNNTGGVSLNTAGGSWGVSPGGIAGGVTAGSGMTVSALTGDFSFGASTGAFLLGALANTVDILSGTVMTLSAGTSLDLASADVVLSLITNHAPALSAPTFSPPVGFKYLIIDDATGQVYKMG